MPQRSISRMLLWGIRSIALGVYLVFAYRLYKAEGYIGLIGVFFSVVLGWLFFYPNRQGQKLAAENMKKAGLQPDRDEALPARKAIDNRSQEK